MARILIVEDDADIADSMCIFLQSKMHAVTVAGSAGQAYAEFNKHEFDLLILDWDLPDESGIEVCKYYRGRGGLAQIFMLTGRTSKADTIEGLSAGADDFLTKPISIAEFDARVEAQLRRATMSTQHPIVFDATMIGKTFAGCYRIEEVLGSGAMGVVFKATHNTIDRTAAIKVLGGGNQWVADRKRFEREARAMSMLNHPRLIRIFDYGIAEQNTPFIVMEFLEGMSLNKVLGTYGAIPAKDAITLIIDVCEGLEHAHAQSIIHRDMKPANIMISEDGNHATILDLGIVKFLNEENGAMRLTMAGEVFGSPLYMSPEQAMNEPLDVRTDVYSLACVLYETISGLVPYNGESFVEITNAKFSGNPISICQRIPHAQLPPALDSLIMKALSLKREKRHSSISEFKQELMDVLALLNNDRRGSKQPNLLSFVKSTFGKKS